MNRIISLCIASLCSITLVFSQEPTTQDALQLAKKELKLIEYERILIQANLEKNNKNYEHAIELYNNALQLYPKSDVAYYELANIFSDKNSLNTAIKYSKKAISLDKHNDDYIIQLAHIYYESEQYKKYINTYTQLQKKYPKNIAVSYKVCDALYNTGMYKKLLKELTKVEKKFGVNQDILFRKFKVYGKLNQPIKAESIATNIVQNYPQRYEYTLAIAYWYYTMQKPHKVLNTLALIPDTYEPYINSFLKVYAYSKLDEPKKLHESLKSMLNESEETTVELIYAIDTALLQNNAMNTIHYKYDILKDLEKSYPSQQHLTQRAMDFYAEIGKPEEVFKRQSILIKEKGANIDTYTLMLEFDTQLLLWDSIAKHAQTAIELYPVHVPFYFYLAMSQLSTYQAEQAIATLTTALEYAFTDELEQKVLQQLAVAHAYNNNETLSMQYFEQAMHIPIFNPDLLYTYAWYAVEFKNCRLAESLLSSKKLPKESYKYVYAYSRMLLCNNKIEESRTMLSSIEQQINSSWFYILFGELQALSGKESDARMAWAAANRLGAALHIEKKLQQFQSK